MKTIIAVILLLSMFSIGLVNSRSPEKAKVMKLMDDINRERRHVSPESANMKEVMWSDCLASVAANYLRQCNAVGSSNENRNTQAAAAGCESFDMTLGETIFHAPMVGNYDPVSIWAMQSRNYNFYENQCTEAGMCDDYLQVANAAVSSVGCAHIYESTCGEDGRSGETYVCYFTPAADNGRPYKQGQSCSDCGNLHGCKNGLCVEEEVTKPTPHTHHTHRTRPSWIPTFPHIATLSPQPSVPEGNNKNIDNQPEIPQEPKHGHGHGHGHGNENEGPKHAHGPAGHEGPKHAHGPAGHHGPNHGHGPAGHEGPKHAHNAAGNDGLKHGPGHEHGHQNGENTHGHHNGGKAHGHMNGGNIHGAQDGAHGLGPMHGDNTHGPQNGAHGHGPMHGDNTHGPQNGAHGHGPMHGDNTHGPMHGDNTHGPKNGPMDGPNGGNGHGALDGSRGPINDFPNGAGFIDWSHGPNYYYPGYPRGHGPSYYYPGYPRGYYIDGTDGHDHWNRGTPNHPKPTPSHKDDEHKQTTTSHIGSGI